MPMKYRDVEKSKRWQDTGKSIKGLWHLMIWNNNLKKEQEKATTVHKKKQDVVVCKYCGELLNKNEADCIWDIINQEMTYCHSDCFDKCEPHGDKIIEKVE